jgi:hypothetical protein
MKVGHTLPGLRGDSKLDFPLKNFSTILAKVSTTIQHRPVTSMNVMKS